MIVTTNSVSSSLPVSSSTAIRLLLYRVRPMLALTWMGLGILLISSQVRSAETTPTPEQALKQLMAGNERYVADKGEHPRSGAERREFTAANGQHPIVTLLACSDARVAPELLFDQGVGDVFQVRVPGNVASEDALSSMEYGTCYLQTPVCVVMGHSECIAVKAMTLGMDLRGFLPKLVPKLVPVVAKARRANPQLTGPALVPKVAEANVWDVIAALYKRYPDVCERVQTGRLKIVGAMYDIRTGAVTWLGPLPDESKLLAHTDKETRATP